MSEQIDSKLKRYAMELKGPMEEVITDILYDTLTFDKGRMDFFQNPISENKKDDETNMYCASCLPTPTRFLLCSYAISLLNETFRDIGFLSSGVFKVIVGCKEYIKVPLIKVIYKDQNIIPLMIPSQQNFVATIEFYSPVNPEIPPKFRVDFNGYKFRLIA